MDEAQRRGFSHSRAGRVLLFVAIVWSVAGSFVAIEIATLGGMDFVLSKPDLVGNLALSNAARDSKTCTVEARASGAGSHTPAEVRVTAWLMGLNIGRDSIARQSASVDRDTLAEVMKDVETLASTLGVPPPEPFVPRQLADANTEFIKFVESDSNETARALARRHSPEACHLFKLGAFWGYANLVRPFLAGERPIFAAEIHHHARRIELDAALWQPMTEGTKSSASGEEIFRSDIALTEALTTHLGSQR
jgi:hypothetical protein